jgi:hypothetical protein
MSGSHELKLEPVLAYQVTSPLAELHPFDRTTGLMQGEILYMGEPTEIIPACR